MALTINIDPREITVAVGKSACCQLNHITIFVANREILACHVPENWEYPLYKSGIQWKPLDDFGMRSLHFSDKPTFLDKKNHHFSGKSTKLLSGPSEGYRSCVSPLVPASGPSRCFPGAPGRVF